MTKINIFTIEEVEEFESLNPTEKREVIKKVSDFSGSVVPTQFNGEAVRLPYTTISGERTDYPVYLLSDNLSHEYIPGKHATDAVSSQKIQISGFRAKGDGVYFHPLSFSSRDHHYASIACWMTAQEIFKKIFDHPKRKLFQEDSTVLWNELERIIKEADVDDISVGGWIMPYDLVGAIRGQVLEALIPKRQIKDHTNGRLINGKFKGYEILSEHIPRENITFVNQPFYTRCEYSSPASIHYVLNVFDDFRKAIEFLAEFGRSVHREKRKILEKLGNKSLTSEYVNPWEKQAKL